MKIDYTKFATKEFPLRASRLEKFISCPWRVVMLTFGAEDKAGEAADTGSAVHAATDTWHKNGNDAASAVAAMRARIAEYPKADMPTAGSLFLAYATDPRNIGVDLVLGETEVTFDIEAEGETLTVVGHVDQVRRADRLSMWDVKTSKKQPHEVLWSTEMQAAAYCYGASKLLGEPVHPGGIIMPRRAPMHIPFTWTYTDIPRILSPLMHLVKLVRQGVIWHNPEADRCRWCHTGGPDVCFPQLRYSLPVVK